MNQLVISEPARIRPVRWGLVTLMVAVALTAAGSLLLGGHDALLAYRPAERLLGVAILFAGLANLTAMILVRQDRAGLATLGFATGAMPGFLLAAVQTGFDQAPRAALWLLASAAPAAAAIATLARGRRPSGGRPSETVLAAVVAATATAAVPLMSLVVGAYQPVTDAQVLDIKLRLAVVAERTGPDGAGYRVVEVRADIANIGKKSLVVMGSRYALMGSASEPRETRTQQEWPIAGEVATSLWSARYEMPRSESLIETGFDILQAGFVLDPGQQTQVNFLVNVPAGRVNTVRASVVLATAFADRLRPGRLLQDARSGQMGADRPVRSVWELEPTSWIAALTRRRPLLQVEYSIDTADGTSGPAEQGTFVETHVRFAFGHSRRELDAGHLPNLEMETFFGANYTDASLQLAIDGTRD
ncbi:hypothetical protein [Actinoplanes sp. L3-i22]|uniref:hypothetical protein n=1 Tax=Actinoplanes sp. L3-i22 TaxID=2836373 RepID=UPI001C76B208|nr:hypothetical protein [Actinoplanes sp. L3-i22]BCY08004.1 hypothetical protein L3i22_030920 [Actinoplanes sp. L3-i22]